jgi:hypothetical protein
MSQHVPASDDDRPMGGTYALVIACHATVIAILWWVGRTFSR